jgi:hypothetical protein
MTGECWLMLGMNNQAEENLNRYLNPTPTACLETGLGSTLASLPFKTKTILKPSLV